MKLNRLQFETSPYLKQHESNPVDWYPWGEEALAKARLEDKPILLSVGYSACHWCHVMAHESFENPQIAQIMNDHYINIKVDREERPDLDQIYQVVAQMITRGGGWPLTVFLTPDLKPFYGGTYFPPTDRYGRPGFGRLLLALAKGYREDRAEIQERAEKMTQVIQNHEEWTEIAPVPVKDVMSELLTGARNLLQKVDWQNGGIGSAPKFPNVSALSYLWRMSLVAQTPNDDRETLREAVVLALEKMRCGGIFDQLGGGFSRYSVDEIWAVPHFEKMLYDNALLLKLYSEVLLQDAREVGSAKRLLSDDQRSLFLSGLRLTVEYLKREMVSADGLFYAAQDADSEGEEGKFFVWSANQLRALLTEKEFEVFARHFGVTENGNFEHATNVLFLAHPHEKLTGHSRTLLESAIQKVWHEREKRIRPGLDDKSLVSWNGLMISGLSWATMAFESSGEDSMAFLAREMAVNAFDALLAKAATGDRLASTVQKGEAKLAGYLDDYAFMAQAALDLARIEIVRSSALLAHAEKWTRVIFEQFSPAAPGFFFTANDHETLIHRPKSLYDQAIPSGSGVTYGVVQVLMQVLDPISQVDFFKQLEQKWTHDSAALIGMAKDHSFGMSEILSSILLSQVSPVTLKGKVEMMYCSHPFCFVVDGSASPVQYCHQQTCHLDPTGVGHLFI